MKENPSLIEYYNRLTDNAFISDEEPFELKNYYPKPTEEDYQRGYITRYICQKINQKNSYIYEINFEQYEKIVNGDNPRNLFFETFQFDWKITGYRHDKYVEKDKKIILEEGIAEFNYKSLKKLEPKIPQILNRFSNLYEFAKIKEG